MPTILLATPGTAAIGAAAIGHEYVAIPEISSIRSSYAYLAGLKSD